MEIVDFFYKKQNSSIMKQNNKTRLEISNLGKKLLIEALGSSEKSSESRNFHESNSSKRAKIFLENKN